MIRVLVVDDHQIVRSGLERILEQADGIEVVSATDSGEEAIEIDLRLEPDVVLMDLSLPGIDGVEATRAICANRPDACVVMLTAHTERDRVLLALDSGAVGYLVKDAAPEDVLAGIRAAVAGAAPMDPRAARVLLDDRRSTISGPSLTKRETQVLKLVAQGLSNKAIARQLAITDKTVKGHLTRVFAQIGVSDRTQAALWAAENGLNSDSTG